MFPACWPPARLLTTQLLTTQLLGVVLGCAFCASTSALDPWQMVDNFQLQPGFESDGKSISPNLSGTITAVGYGFTAPNSFSGVVRESLDDSGLSWSSESTIFDFGPGHSSQFKSLAVDSGRQILYIGGEDAIQTSTGFVYYWTILRSTDNGVTWTLDDHYQETPGVNAILKRVRVDADGVVYACGYVDSPTGFVWITRQRDRNGTWKTVDSVRNPPAKKQTSIILSASDIAFHPKAGIFAVGDTLIGAATPGWGVRRSTDNGNTWTQVDALPGSARAIAISTGPNDQRTIYVVGKSTVEVRRKQETCWIVRSSSNDGATWATVDTLQNIALDSLALCAAADSFGNVYVAGMVPNSTTAYGMRWVVRKLASGTQQWQTSDDFQLAATTGSFPDEIAADAQGNVFCIGHAADANAPVHWVTRRLARY